MCIVEVLAPAESNILVTERKKRSKNMGQLVDLRSLYPQYKLNLVALLVGVLGGTKD